MTVAAVDPMHYFPYRPRPHQDDAVRFTSEVYSSRTVGLLSADCGVGKTVAVLSGYLAARASDPSSRLVVLTRTHSQSDVFESELGVLRSKQDTGSASLTATSLVSRIHTCPIRDTMDSLSSAGFLRACSIAIKSGRCIHYWNLYASTPEGRIHLPPKSREVVEATLRNGVVTRALAEETANENVFCPYELMRCCARQSRVIIGPYSYMFKTRVRNALLSSLDFQLSDIDLLIDESHNLAHHVLDAESATLSGKDVAWLRENRTPLAKETGVKWLDEAVDFLWETIMLGMDQLQTGGEKRLERWEAVPRYIERADLERLIVSSGVVDDLDVAVHTETPIDRLVEYLYTGLLASQSEEWHITLESKKSWTEGAPVEDVNLVVRPLNAAGLCAPVLRGVRAAVLMSGTLRPVVHYARLLGVPGSSALDLSSPYPRGSRLVLIDREVETTYRKRSPEMWRLIAQRISAALTTMPSEKTALIAFPSYQVMDEVLSFGIDTGHRVRIVEDRTYRIEDLREDIERRPSAVFLVYGGKFSEGVDLVSGGRSMVDLIIGVGIPFTPPTDYQLALQGFYEARFGAGAGYYYSAVVPSLRSVAQLVGRLRRSPEDWGVVMLLDRRFLKHLDVFGPDFAGDVWLYNGIDEAMEAMAVYLQNRVQEAGLR